MFQQIYPYVCEIPLFCKKYYLIKYFNFNRLKTRVKINTQDT